MQTSFSADMTVAVPGQLADCAQGQDIVTVIAVEDLYPGRLVEISSGLGRLPQATTLGKYMGVAVYTAGRESAVYAAGEAVPVLRKGRIYGEKSSSATEATLTAANVKHSSTTATNRGKFSADATSTTSGAEISATTILFVQAVSATNLALLELNLP